MMHAIGIDIGGSHVSGGIVHLDTHEIAPNSYQQKTINPLASADEILATWCNLIFDIHKTYNGKVLSKIGFAMPGPFDYKKGIARFEGVPKYTHLYGINVGKVLSQMLLEKTGVQFDLQFTNDAAAFALGEYAQGAAQNIDRCWVLTLGTGLGSTFLDHGIPQLKGIGMPDGGYLYNQDFKDGIADEYFSTRWFLNKDSRISSVKALSLLAQKGDANAKNLFAEFGAHLGIFLSPWLRHTKAKGVIIGGGIAQAWDLFHPTLAAQINTHALDITIKKATLGGHAPIIGTVI